MEKYLWYSLSTCQSYETWNNKVTFFSLFAYTPRPEDRQIVICFNDNSFQFLRYHHICIHIIAIHSFHVWNCHYYILKPFIMIRITVNLSRALNVPGIYSHVHCSISISNIINIIS